MAQTTKLFQEMNAADEAWRADEMNIQLLNASDAAHAAYYGAIREARAKWEALAAGYRKDCAEINAFDTEGCLEDELRWFQVALATYEMDDCTG